MAIPTQSAPGGDDALLSPVENDKDTLFRDSTGTKTTALKLTADGSVPIEGTVTAVVPDPLPVTGTVNVGNFPATQPVSGSVAVTNFPATQNVDITVDSVGLAKDATVAKASTQTDGSQKTQVTNFPATQPVSGSVTATPPALPSTAIVGQTKITVTGTAVQLSSGVLVNGVVVSANLSNTAPITIGGSGVTNTVDGTGNGYILQPGSSVGIAVINTNDLYINGMAGDVVAFIGS